MGSIFKGIELQGLWASSAHAGAFDTLDGEVVPQARGTLGVCGAVILVFCSKIVVGLLGQHLVSVS